MTAIGPLREAIAKVVQKRRERELVGGARWRRSKRIVLGEVVGGVKRLDSKERRR